MGLGATLAAAIGIGTIGGRKIDDHYSLEKPLGAACGALLGLTTGLWTVIKNTKNQQK